MRPVFGVRAAAAEQHPVERRAVVRPHAGEYGQVVAALEDVDGVDLQQAEAPDLRGQAPRARRVGVRPAEALRSQGHASGEGGGDGIDHAATLPATPDRAAGTGGTGPAGNGRTTAPS